MKICELWFLIVEKIAAVHGAPLPKGLLTLGTKGEGWLVRLNNTDVDVDSFARFAIAVEWNGFPAGWINHHGGLIAAGDNANEESFREWLGQLPGAIHET